jgi:four helix bundle protein
MSKSYRDLHVWQMSMDCAVAIYAFTARFPPSELYGMTSQLRRASVSVPSNIAEGHGRRTLRQPYKFLEDALGSVFEIETQLELARRLGYVRTRIFNRWRNSSPASGVDSRHS